MHLFLKTIKVNKVYNIMLIIQMAFLLCLVNGETSNLIKQYKLEHYITAESDMYYMSIGDNIFDAPSVSTKNMETFNRYIENKWNVNVGYVLSTFANMDNKQTYLVYANQTMCKIRYMLDSGRWFDNSGKPQVILGYEYKGQYKIGDTVLLSQSEDNEIYAKVIGFFQAGNNIMQLNTAGEKMSYEDILGNMDRVNDYFVYTNAIDVSEKWEGLKSFSNALIVQGEKSDIASMSKYGTIESFEEIKENSKGDTWKSYRTSGVYVALILFLFFNSILLLAVISYKNNINMYRVFYMCGMKRVKIFTFSMMHMAMNCECTFLIDLLLLSLMQEKWEHDLGIKLKIVGGYLLAVMVVHCIYCIIMMVRIKYQCTGRKLEYEN